MTLKKGTKEIRGLLDALAEKKTDKDRLFVLFKMKGLVESMEEPLKQRSDQKKVAYDGQTRIIKKALRQLLTAFDRIYAKHEEVGDSDVRDQMYVAIYRSFIQPQRGYSLPQKFGMFSDQGNDSVRVALHKFLTHPEVLAASRALKSPEDRFAAFQDDDVQTSEDTTCFEYFGYSNKVRVA
jgi:hypothetical protein